MPVELKTLKDWVREYRAERPRYVCAARVLRAFLEHAARPVCTTVITQARAKTVESFAAKCVRKWEELKHKKPLEELGDLCGGRAIVQLTPEVEQVWLRMKDCFFEPKVEDTTERLSDEQFGYGSWHINATFDKKKLLKRVTVAQLSKASPDGKITRSDINKADGTKLEIQIRTFAQHVTADFSHDRFYKCSFDVPRTWRRESAKVSAQLEAVDKTLVDVDEGMRLLQTNVGHYMKAHEADEEIARLDAILEFDKNNVGMMARISSLYLSRGKYEEAKTEIEAFMKARREENAPEDWNVDLASNYGYALCRLYEDQPRSEAYDRGIVHLEAAVKNDPYHVEALTRLAELTLDDKEEEAYSRRAYEAAPWEPRALIGYLLRSLHPGTAYSLISMTRPAIERAISTCKKRLECKVDLPFVLHHLSLLELLAGRPMESLDALGRAIALTGEPVMRHHLLDRFKLLRRVQLEIPGLAWCMDVLSLSLYKKSKLHKRLPKLAVFKDIEAPVIIIAGGCDPRVEKRITDQYGKMLAVAFKEFVGTIVSGGTKQGVSGLGGDIIRDAKKDGRSIIGVSYLPDRLPPDAKRDSRYKKYHWLTHDAAAIAAECPSLPGPFLPIEPIQTWVDLLASGIEPNEVKLIGIDGGVISRFEFRLAAALGARVAVIRDSGRAADELAKEQDHPGNEMIMFMPPDPQTLREFVRGRPSKNQSPFSEQEIEKLRNGVDNAYHRKRAEQAEEERKRKVTENAKLAEAFRNSNRDQVLHITRKLAEFGKEIASWDDPRPTYKLTSKEIEFLAEMEHGRWNVERLLAGWVLGPNDDQRRSRASLKEWRDLEDSYRALDIHSVEVIPELLKGISRKIVSRENTTS